jgi:hypothetical protein
MHFTNSLLVHIRAPIIPSGSPRNGKSKRTGIAPHRIMSAFARHPFLREKCYSETASRFFVPSLCLQHCARSVEPFKAQCTFLKHSRLSKNNEADTEQARASSLSSSLVISACSRVILKEDTICITIRELCEDPIDLDPLCHVPQLLHPEILSESASASVHQAAVRWSNRARHGTSQDIRPSCIKKTAVEVLLLHHTTA